MEALGIEPKLILANIISFLLFFFVMAKYVYPFFLKWMDKEARQLAETKENYEKSRQEMEEVDKKREDLLQKAKKDINELLTEAKTEGKEILRKAEDNAVKNAENVKIKAAKEIESQKEEIISEAKKQSVEAAVKIVSKIMSDLDQKNAHDLINKAIKEI